MSTINVVQGRWGQLGDPAWGVGRERHNRLFPPSTLLSTQMPYGSHSGLPSSPKLVLINATSIHKLTHLVHNLIVDEGADLACIAKAWLREEEDVNLSLLCLPGLGI